MRTLAAVAAIITLSLPLFLVYQAMNWSMAYSYTRREAGEPRLLKLPFYDDPGPAVEATGDGDSV